MVSLCFVFAFLFQYEIWNIDLDNISKNKYALQFWSSSLSRLQRQTIAYAFTITRNLNRLFTNIISILISFLVPCHCFEYRASSHLLLSCIGHQKIVFFFCLLYIVIYSIADWEVRTLTYIWGAMFILLLTRKNLSGLPYYYFLYHRPLLHSY